MTTLYDRLNLLAKSGLWEWPENAREWLDEGIVASDPETRALACNAASQDVDDRMAHSLLYLLCRDEEAEVASAAAIALGPALQMWDEDRDFGDLDIDLEEGGLSEDVGQEIMSELKAVYEDGTRPKVVRRKCLEAAVRGPLTWQPDAVKACYDSNDNDWVTTAVFCMSFVPGFEDEIREELGNEDENIKCEALRTAGQCSLQEAADAIMEVASDSNAAKSLRLAALEALASVAAQGSRALLEELREGGDDSDIVNMAAYALEERRVFGVDEDEEW